MTHPQPPSGALNLISLPTLFTLPTCVILKKKIKTVNAKTTKTKISKIVQKFTRFCFFI